MKYVEYEVLPIKCDRQTIDGRTNERANKMEQGAVFRCLKRPLVQGPYLRNEDILSTEGSKL